MKNAKNIILIGMPGAGKSTIGVVLAKCLGLDFIDSDLVIQKTQGRLLYQLIEQEGVEGFLEIENRINAKIMPQLPSVIATGGSVVYGKEAMEHFARIGTIVYLKLGLSSLGERLGNLEERGVALKKGQSLTSLYEERIPLYEQYADLTINCENKEIRENVEEILIQIAQKEEMSL